MFQDTPSLRIRSIVYTVVRQGHKLQNTQNSFKGGIAKIISISQILSEYPRFLLSSLIFMLCYLASIYCYYYYSNNSNCSVL